MLFCLQAAGALVQAGSRERWMTLFDDYSRLRNLLRPVNRLAVFLYSRRNTPEYDTAWEAAHEFVCSIVYCMHCVYT